MGLLQGSVPDTNSCLKCAQRGARGMHPYQACVLWHSRACREGAGRPGVGVVSCVSLQCSACAHERACTRQWDGGGLASGTVGTEANTHKLGK